MGCTKSSAKKEVYSSISLPRETSNKQPNLTPKATRKRRRRTTTKTQKTPTVSRRKEIIKIRAEINKKKMKETIAKINKIVRKLVL